MGPSLINMETDFPTDQALKNFLRKGKGMMPAQAIDTINDEEMKNLIVYLHTVVKDLKESEKK